VIERVDADLAWTAGCKKMPHGVRTRLLLFALIFLCLPQCHSTGVRGSRTHISVKSMPSVVIRASSSRPQPRHLVRSFGWRCVRRYLGSTFLALSGTGAPRCKR
jgi:hypothetical protein